VRAALRTLAGHLTGVHGAGAATAPAHNHACAVPRARLARVHTAAAGHFPSACCTADPAGERSNWCAQPWGLRHSRQELVLAAARQARAARIGRLASLIQAGRKALRVQALARVELILRMLAGIRRRKRPVGGWHALHVLASV